MHDEASIDEINDELCREHRLSYGIEITRNGQKTHIRYDFCRMDGPVRYQVDKNGISSTYYQVLYNP